MNESFRLKLEGDFNGGFGHALTGKGVGEVGYDTGKIIVVALERSVYDPVAAIVFDELLLFRCQFHLHFPLYHKGLAMQTPF